MVRQRLRQNKGFGFRNIKPWHILVLGTIMLIAVFGIGNNMFMISEGEGGGEYNPPMPAPTIVVWQAHISMISGTTGNVMKFLTSEGAGRNIYIVSIDSGSGTSYAWASNTILVNLDSLTAGFHTVKVTVFDIYNMQVTANGDVSVTGTNLPPPPPSWTLIVTPEDLAIRYTYGTTGHDVIFTIVHSEQIWSATAFIDNNPIGATLSNDAVVIDVDNLDVGSHGCIVTVTDVVGHKGSGTMEVTVTQPLPPTITAPSPITYTDGTSGNTIAFTTASVSRSTYDVSIDSGTSVSYTWSTSSIVIDVDGLSIGDHIVSVTVYDSFSQSDSASGTVTVSSSPPPPSPPTITGSDMTYVVGTTGNTLAFQTTVTAIRVSYSVSIDSGSVESFTWSTSTITINVDGLAMGRHTVAVTVTDSNGKIATTNKIVTVKTSSSITPTPDYSAFILGFFGLFGIVIIYSLIRRGSGSQTRYA